MQSEAQVLSERSTPGPERDCSPALAPLRPRQSLDATPATRHDARYWEAVDRLDFFDPAN